VISFVVPAYNESEFLPATLEAIHSAARSLGLAYEIVVANDASTDDTAAVAEAHGARVVACANRQIAATRNSGAAAANGNYLIFVDADTTVSRAVVDAAVRTLDEGAAGGGAAVRFGEPVQFQWRVFLWTVVHSFRLLRWAAGSFVFCRTDAFEAAGGFDETMYAAEEIAVSRALKRQGRFVVLREYVETSGRKFNGHSSWKIFFVLASIVLGGRRAVSRRRGLEIWYADGTREDDPKPARHGTGLSG